MSLIAQLAALAQGPFPLRVEVHAKDKETLQVSLIPSSPQTSESTLSGPPSSPLLRVLTQPVAFLLPAAADDLDQQLATALAELETTRAGLAGDLARLRADAESAHKAAQEAAAKKTSGPAKADAPRSAAAAPAPKGAALAVTTPDDDGDDTDSESPADSGQAADDSPGLFD